MEVEARTWVSFDRDVIVDAGLIGEGFEKGGDAPSALFIKVGYGVGAIVSRRGTGAVGKTVADKQNALDRVCRACRHRK